MATLTLEERAELRNKAERLANQNGVPISYIKAEINAALQALEDWWETPATKAAASAAIDAATSFSFTNQQKKIIGRFWLEQKARREEVGI